MMVVGNLFVPKNLNQNARNPAIVVGHPMGAVKEQSANLYAQKLADQGFVTLSLDLSRSEEHTSELQSRFDLVCRLLLEKKNIRPESMVSFSRTYLPGETYS